MSRILTAPAAALAFLVTVSGGVAHAGIVEIGQFTGDITEDWESFQNYQQNPLTYEASPATIFGGAATITNSRMAVYEPSFGATFGLADAGSAKVADGLKGMGLDTGPASALIEFDTPVSSFGSFWGAAVFGTPAVVTLEFFDTNDILIGAATFQYDRPGDGVLEWHGWSSGTPIASLTYSGDYVVVDGMQAAPAPGALALLGLAGLAGRRRRR